MWGWIIGGVVGGIALIAYVQHRAQAGIYRPLASRQPERPKTQDVPLGMEAIDMTQVNNVARRNESLERAHTNWTNRGGLRASTDVPPMADDETYAAKYHAAFLKDKPKGRTP